MSNLRKTIRTGLVAGACGLGLCALAKKLKLSTRVADLAHAVEGVPFPGINLYSFLAAKQMKSLYAQIAEEIAAAGHYDRVLDLGTGVGYLPLEIARRCAATQLIGLDKSSDMIQVAQANARAYSGAECVDFATGDPTNLPFPGRYFDLVVSVGTLHHWSDPLAVLEEVHHSLIPGGQFWIYDYKREVPEQVWESIELKLPMYLCIPFMVGPKASWRASLRRDKVLELISKTHFEIESYEDRSYTLFGRSMPVFSRLILRKPEQTRENGGQAEGTS